MTLQELQLREGRRWRRGPPGVDRMAVSAGCRCLRGARPRAGGAAATVPTMRWVDRGLVGVRAPPARRGGPADLDPAGALRVVRGDAGTAALVRAEPALGRGGGDRPRP